MILTCGLKFNFTMLLTCMQMHFRADMYLATTGADPPDPEGDPMKMFKMLCPGKHWSEGVLLHLAAASPPPRMLKAHVALDYFPPDITKKCKVIKFFILKY